MKLKYIKYVLCFFALIVSTTLSAAAGNILHGPIYQQTNILPNEKSVLIYRENDGDIKNTAIIFINNNIVMASLLPDEYVQTKVCTSKIKLRVATRGDLVAKGLSRTIKIKKSQITYIKLIKTPNKIFTPIVVDDTEGQKAFNSIKTRSNIINRYVPKMILGTDSLFAFNSSILLPSALETMDKLVKDIEICPNKINLIKITGHTDRIGSVAFNERLSKRRAKAVADYLVNHGIKTPMDVDGHGSSEPVTTSCRGKLSSKLIKCLMPDRRVVVELINDSVK